MNKFTLTIFLFFSLVGLGQIKNSNKPVQPIKKPSQAKNTSIPVNNSTVYATWDGNKTVIVTFNNKEFTFEPHETKTLSFPADRYVLKLTSAAGKVYPADDFLILKQGKTYLSIFLKGETLYFEKETESDKEQKLAEEKRLSDLKRNEEEQKARNLLKESLNGYNVKIKVNGLNTTGLYKLGYYYGDKTFIADTAALNDQGEFLFVGSKKWPQGIYFFLSPTNSICFEFVMDEKQSFSLVTDVSNYVKNMKVIGSDENTYFFEHQNFLAIKHTDAEINDFKTKYNSARPKAYITKLFNTMPGPEIPNEPLLSNGKKDPYFSYYFYKAHYFDNFDLTDDRILRSPIFKNKIIEYMDKLTVQNPDSISAASDYVIEKSRSNPEMFKYLVSWLTSTYESSKIMGYDAVFVHLVDKYYKTKQVFWVAPDQISKIINRGTELKPLLIGQKAPEIELQDVNEKLVPLSSIKSKYTILLFWGPDCSHCQTVIASLTEQYKNLKTKGVEVYAIGTQDDPSAWKKFIKDNQLSWTNVMGTSENQRGQYKKIYDIYSTPVIYLLDENKIIKAKRVDVAQTVNFIDAIEKEKLKNK